MSQVSSQYIDNKVKRKIERLFSYCIKQCRDDNTVAEFVDDLLTPTEKIMLAKRVAIALMILKKNTYEEIKNKLKVSKSTIWKVSTWLSAKGKGYRKLLSEIIKMDSDLQNEHSDALWDLENQFIPSPGHNWKSDAHNRWHKAEKTEVPF